MGTRWRSLAMVLPGLHAGQACALRAGMAEPMTTLAEMTAVCSCPHGASVIDLGPGVCMAFPRP